MQNVVVASLETLPNGRLRLVLDDAVRDPTSSADHWVKRAPFTQLDLPIAEGEVSDQALADIGFNLIARLRATNGLGA